MKPKSSALWIGIPFAVALGIATAVLATNGTDPKGLVNALQMTARWAFILFFLAYAGGAIATLFGSAFSPIARRGREFGLAYAAAMLVHVGLIVWIFQISAKPPLGGKILLFFLTGLVFTYILAVLSFGRLAQILGPTGWRIFRITAMNYIMFVFAYDFVPTTIRVLTGSYGLRDRLKYAPFAAMSVAAPLLVLAAAVHTRLGSKHSHAETQPAAYRAN
jgi:hypothetical protein